RLARDGYVVGKRQAQTIVWSWPFLRANETTRRIFGDPRTQNPVPAGRRIRHPGLATALERIAAQGPAGFYEGPTAADLVASVEPHGVLTLKDLARYQAKVREPLRFPYRGWVVETMPPPSAGGVALAQTLLMLQEQQAWRHPLGSPEALHSLAESARSAHAERRFHLLDPDALASEAPVRKRR